ncbi:MAG: 6-phosphofructokinase [Anaerolineales bacterium]|jgi:6-phosphofructokinase
MMTKRVAILTGGGDVPGLNMCLKSLVYRLIDLGFEPIGVRMGWEGLISYNPLDPSTYSESFIELTKNIVRPIDRTPGSFLHSSRVDVRSVPANKVPDFLKQQGAEYQDLTDHVQEVVKRLGYRALVVIGDDDMLHVAAHLSQQGMPVIGIPKTIHNNIHGTDYTLGFSTGLARGVAFVHELRALAGSREQIIVVETFAAKSGYSTLLMGLLSGADRVVIPEVPYDPEHLAALLLQDKRETPANYAVAMICDGSYVQEDKVEQYADVIAHNIGSTQVSSKYLGLGEQDGNPLVGSGMILTELLTHVTHQEVFQQELTYLLRTGMPDGQDLLGALNFAFTAAELVEQGVYGRMTAFNKNAMWTHVNLDEAREGVKTVDVETWYDRENYKPNLKLIWSVDRQ